MDKSHQPTGVQINVPCGRLYVEPYVRLVSGACFGVTWIGRRSYSNDAIIREGTKIGRYCSIARRITLGAQSHQDQWLSTHPFQKEGSFKKPGRDFAIKETIIGNDVWICENVVVIAGIRIGDGAIVASGSVVTKDVEPYAVVGGVPARLIRKRFDGMTINRLLKIRWWELGEQCLIDLPFDDVRGCLDILEGTPNLDARRVKDEFRLWEKM